MNFITKNLGWILLLLFFVFMLFIISSNDPQRVNLSNTGANNSGATLSGETDKNLDDLIKLIDNEEIVEEVSVEEESVLGNQEVIEEQEEEEEQEEKEETSVSGSINGIEEVNNIQEEDDSVGFFARLFGRDNDTEENEEILTQSGSVNSNEDTTENEGEEDIKISQNEVSTSNANISEISSNTNIIKSTSQSQIVENVDTKIVYPGSDLITKVGNKYEVGVEMLKLNNKSFTQSSAIMMKGDQVEQLSEENSYGCFQILVITTGAKGYVCKKYLSKTSEVSIPKIDTTEINTDVVQEVIESKQDNIAIPKITTKVGSYYKINIENTSFFDVILERFTLQVGDVLKQTSLANAKTGCVNMRVVGTATGIHDGKLVSICSPDMVVVVN